MPKTARNKVIRSELPRTIRRSPLKAQRTYAKAHDAAVKTYGSGERTHRTAYAALKHSFEKVGDHWEPKDRPGPSDPRAKKTASQARRGKGETFGGVDVLGSSKQKLMQRARKLGVRSVSRMSKEDLGRAIEKKQKAA